MAAKFSSSSPDSSEVDRLQPAGITMHVSSSVTASLLQGYAWLMTEYVDRRHRAFTRADLVEAAEYLNVPVRSRDTLTSLLGKIKVALLDQATAKKWAFKVTCTDCRAEFIYESSHAFDGALCPTCRRQSLLCEVIGPGAA